MHIKMKNIWTYESIMIAEFSDALLSAHEKYKFYQLKFE